MSGQSDNPFREKLDLESKYFETQDKPGLTPDNQEKLAQTQEYLEKASAADPENREICLKLGLCLQARRLDREALPYLEKAFRLAPERAEILVCAGFSCQRLGNYERAKSFYTQALKINPQLPRAYNNLGILLAAEEKHEEAKALYLKALDASPNFAGAYQNLASLLKLEGRLDEAMAYLRRALAIDPKLHEAHSNLLLMSLYLPQLTPHELFLEHQQWGLAHAPAQLAQPSHSNDPVPERRLRIGYVTPDACDHSVSFFLEPLAASHNKQTVETYCYANVAKPDIVTARLKLLFENWRDTTALSDAKTAELIRGDKIDILVDLAGHSKDNRLPAFARKPAPVQITYLGYPATTGLGAIDYRLTDRWADPPGSQAYHTETLLYLPDGFLCYGSPFGTPPVATLPALKKGHLTFGSFNMIYKVSEEALKVWSRILQALPDAKMVLKSISFQNKKLRNHYLELFGRQGIAPERIKIFGMEPLRANHLGLYGEIDIALDTFPYNGTTTTCDALWMGVPVITLAGDKHAGRVGVSLLSQTGLTEFIAQTPDEYVGKAVKLASDLPFLSALRNRLRAALKSSPLCDSRAFARKLEETYRFAWRKWCTARAPGNQSTRQPPPEEPVPATPAGPGQGADQIASQAISTSEGTPAAKVCPAEPSSVPAGSAIGLALDTAGTPRPRPYGHPAEMAILADALARWDKRADALAYAMSGLAYIEQGQFAGGAPEALLAAWQAPSLPVLLLRQCLSYSCHSSYFDRPRSQNWLMKWAKQEPGNAEPFLRFALLFAAEAALVGSSIPPAALQALQHAKRLRPDERTSRAAELIKDPPREFSLACADVRLHLKPDLCRLSTFVLLEQGGWFEKELDLFRLLPRPGDRVLDLGAETGIYALSAASRVGAGLVAALEPSGECQALLKKSAAPFKNLRLLHGGINGQTGTEILNVGRRAELRRPGETETLEKVRMYTLAEIIGETGGQAFDLIKLDVGGREKNCVRGAESALRKHPAIILYQARENGGLDWELIKAFQKLGYESYYYAPLRRALVRYTGQMEIDPFICNLFAIHPERLPRAASVATIE